MYKNQIEEYFHNHKDEMLNDICDLIRIRSDRSEAKEDMPFGEVQQRLLRLL